VGDRTVHIGSTGRILEIRVRRADTCEAMTRAQEPRTAASKPLGMKRVVAGLAGLVLLGSAVAAGSAQGAAGPAVWFLRAGEPVSVPRRAQPLPALVRSLLAGPTAAERARGLRTAIPRGTAVRSVGVRRQVVTIDLAARFAAGVDTTSLRDRAGQVVRTLLGVRGVKAVTVRVEGGVPVGLFPGYDLRRPVTAAFAPRPAVRSARDVQQLLVDLGFMGQEGVNGSLDAQTGAALLAFQKWSGFPRDGIATPVSLAALDSATRPQPALRAPGHRIEVQLDRQLALLIDDGRVERVVHISSGAYGKTPIGTFSVYRKERYSWSVPFKVWLPWASYFTGGVAFHEFGSVPTYAASHGCVRVNHYDARLLYDFARVGTQVDVFHEAQV
jgi:hypothetical protein